MLFLINLPWKQAGKHIKPHVRKIAMSYREYMVGVIFLWVMIAGAFATVPAMTKAEMASTIQSEAIFIPTPGEFFVAIDKEGKRNWPSLLRNIAHPPSADRAQMALNLGTLIADGYISVEAQDSQQVKNIGKDILSIAKTLGVSQDVLNRGQSITDFAENNDWSGLKEELEATQNEVKSTMEKQQDQKLVILVNVGAWIRGIQAVSTLVDNDYSPKAAQLLRQSAIAHFLLENIATLPPRTLENAFVVRAKEVLDHTYSQLNNPKEPTPSLETVQAIRKSTASFIDELNVQPVPEVVPATSSEPVKEWTPEPTPSPKPSDAAVKSTPKIEKIPSKAEQTATP